MKKIILLFLAALPLLAFNTAHKFYVSATDIEYNEKQRSLQVISYVFTDDLEDLLQSRYSKDLVLVKNNEHPSANEFVEQYFRSKFSISVNGKDRLFNYIGKEYDKDQLLVYLEVEDVETVNTIGVKNGILTDLFPEQKNVVKVAYGGTVKSLLLMRDALSGTLNFGN